MSIPPPHLVLDLPCARVEREWKHGRALVGCRFDPTGRFLFVSAEDDTIQRYDLLTGAKTAFVGHASWVRGLAFAAPIPTTVTDSAAWTRARAAEQSVVGFGVAGVAAPGPAPFTLISADYHGKLIWWSGNADTPKPVKSVAAHDGYARAVVVSPDNSTVASCGNDRLVKLWGAADGAPLQTLEGHQSHVYNLAFSPDGKGLVSCDLKGTVKDWDLATGRCRRDLDAKVLHKYDPSFMADIGGARGMVFSPDGSTLALCGITNVSNAFAGVGNPAVLLIDWNSEKTNLLKLKTAFQGTAWGVGFLASGAVVAAGGSGQGRVWFFKRGDFENVHTLSVPANCRDLAVSPGGDRFAVAGANGSALIYDFTGLSAAMPPAAKK
jgi:WD40 repeat protein